MFDPHHFIAERVRAIDASDIRRMFDLAASLDNPVNLSIGQPDFDVPPSVKAATIDAISKGRNRYTVTQGDPELRQRVLKQICEELPNWRAASDQGAIEILITSGVSGALVLAMMTCVGPGDEVVLPDPYFVMYRHLVTLAGATAVYVDTYPDFQLTAERVEAVITDKAKMLLFSSPSNPTGVVITDQSCRQLVDLADTHNLLLVCDEIYDEFCYEKIERPSGSGILRAPSLAAHSDRVLLLRGFSKSYGMPGWRLGYAAGPKPVIDQMTKLQQYTFVCAPSVAQAGAIVAFDVDMSQCVRHFLTRRDRVVERLAEAYELTIPGGAFYAFPEVPQHLGVLATEFVERAIARGLLVIPGSAFSRRDTHLRLSYACDDAMLERGLDILVEMAN